MLRLARAFEQRGEGELAFVGDGPLRGALEGRPKIHLAGTVDHDAGRRVDRRSGRRLPAEPRRAVRPRDARRARVGTIGRRDARRRPARVRAAADAGVLVDPTDDDAVARRARCGGAAPASQPRGPERRRGARRQAAGGAGGGASASCCSFSRSASLISTSGPDGLLEPRGAGRLERRLVALAHLVERHALLEPVVAGHEEMLDLRARILRSGHGGTG